MPIPIWVKKHIFQNILSDQDSFYISIADNHSQIQSNRTSPSFVLQYNEYNTFKIMDT